jgi:hypothetical protein
MKIMVADEKHVTRYLRASTQAELEASALKLLTERHADGYWYVAPDEPTFKASTTLEQAQALPEGPIRVAALGEHAKMKRGLIQYEQDLADYKKIIDAVERKDGKLAWECLRARRDYEYENVKLEELE